MTAQETSLLVGAFVGLLAALQTWLTVQSVNHGKQLDGLMAPRIAEGAAAVVEAQRVTNAGQPVVVTDPVKQARIEALQTELDSLRN